MRRFENKYYMGYCGYEYRLFHTKPERKVIDIWRNGATMDCYKTWYSGHGSVIMENSKEAIGLVESLGFKTRDELIPCHLERSRNPMDAMSYPMVYVERYNGILYMSARKCIHLNICGILVSPYDDMFKDINGSDGIVGFRIVSDK